LALSIAILPSLPFAEFGEPKMMIAFFMIYKLSLKLSQHHCPKPFNKDKI
jgi:hypothetical protein